MVDTVTHLPRVHPDKCKMTSCLDVCNIFPFFRQHKENNPTHTLLATFGNLGVYALSTTQHSATSQILNKAGLFCKVVPVPVPVQFIIHSQKNDWHECGMTGQIKHQH